MADVRRKVVSWEEVDRDPEWYATLECGHKTPGPYDSGLSDKQMLMIEQAGYAVCVECNRIESDIAKAEQALAMQKARRNGSST